MEHVMCAIEIECENLHKNASAKDKLRSEWKGTQIIHFPHVDEWAECCRSRPLTVTTRLLAFLILFSFVFAKKANRQETVLGGWPCPLTLSPSDSGSPFWAARRFVFHVCLKVSRNSWISNADNPPNCAWENSAATAIECLTQVCLRTRERFARTLNAKKKLSASSNVLAISGVRWMSHSHFISRCCRFQP